MGSTCIGCSRATPEQQSRTTVSLEPANKNDPTLAAPSTPAPPSSTTQKSLGAVVASVDRAQRPYRFPAAERVVALGDLHGDLASAREALRLAGAIDAKDAWVGGKMVLVQVGDQLDRGDDEPQILALLEQLQRDGAKTGGAVHVLNGNHELMNAVGDLRYVTEDGMRDYAAVAVDEGSRLPRGLPSEMRGRAAAFAPGSELARKLAERNTILIVGDTVFAHAGVLAKHVRYGVGRINDEVSSFLLGRNPTLPEVVASDDAPVWTRLYGGATNDQTCKELDAVLTALEVKRMVVGHTVQQAGVTSACGEKVYRVDVGLSDYYGKHNATQVLELTAKGAKILAAGNTSP